MGSETAKGYPYPLGTDRVMDGDDAIKALAEAVDSQAGVQASGQVSFVFSGNTQVVMAITFPSGRFTVAPDLLLGLILGPGSTQGPVWVRCASLPTTTGASLACNFPSGAGYTGTVVAAWHAHQN